MGIKRRNNASPAWLGFLALVFAGFGVAAFCYVGWMFWTWNRMASWVPVPAEIATLKLERHRDDDAVTHKVAAHYRYTFDGHKYEGDRVAIASMSDNIGHFQQDLYRSLESSRKRRAAIAFVDPAHPADSTLNRDLRWLLVGLGAMFALVFGGAGCGLLFAARVSAEKLGAERKLQRQFPTSPWRWRKEWKGGHIAASRAGAYAVLIFAALWNLISSPVVFFVPGAIAHGNWIVLVALVFPAIGIGLAVWAIRSWRRLKRFKGTTLVLDHTPIPLGGRMQATIRVDALVPVNDGFKLQLNCVQEERSTSDSDSNERLLWQNEWTVPKERCQLMPTYSEIPVTVDVPDDLPESSTSKDDNGITWRLEITGECPGPDFEGLFEVPVFEFAQAHKARTQRSPAAPVQPARESEDWLGSLEAEETARSAARAAPDASAPTPDRLAALGIDYERLPGGRETWTFRRAQHKGVAAGLTAATLVWTAISVVLWFTDAPLIFPVVFGIFDALFVWWTLQLWFAEYRVGLDERVLTITARGATGTRRYDIPRGRIARIRARRGMQAGNKLYYDLKVETRDGKSRTAATTIADYSVADGLAKHWMGTARQAAEPAAAVSAAPSSSRFRRRAAN